MNGEVEEVVDMDMDVILSVAAAAAAAAAAAVVRDSLDRNVLF